MRTYFRYLFGFFEVEGTPKKKPDKRPWRVRGSPLDGSSLYNYIYWVTYIWLCGVVVVALCGWV